jgi:hypothetical protein
MSAPGFQNEWKGRVLGSFTLADLRGRLASGEFSRLHRIYVEGTWRPLGEWLDALEASHRNAQAGAQAQADRELEAERSRSAALEQRLQQAAWQMQQPVHPGQPAPAVAHLPHDPPGNFAPFSGHAIASLVFSSLCAVFLAVAFILISEEMPRWVGMLIWLTGISWILGVMFGHVALSEIRRDEQLRGRGLALAGLAVAYSVIVLLTACIFRASLHDYRYLIRP